MIIFRIYNLKKIYPIYFFISHVRIIPPILIELEKNPKRVLREYNDTEWCVYDVGKFVLQSYESDGQDGIKVYTTPIELTCAPEVCVGRDRQWDTEVTVPGARPPALFVTWNRTTHRENVSRENMSREFFASYDFYSFAGTWRGNIIF